MALLETLKRYALAAGIGILSSVNIPSAQAEEYEKKLWVFSDEISKAKDRKALVQHSVNEGIDTLYLSIYREKKNKQKNRMYDEKDISDLITQAHDAGIEVWAAYGAEDWARRGFLLGCSKKRFPLRRMQEVVKYNENNPEAIIDGIMLDVEVKRQDFIPLLKLYECILPLKKKDIQIGTAIPAFWEREFEYRGKTRAMYKHIIELDFDQIVVMGYRDRAGHSSQGGIIDLNKDEIYYAERKGKEGQILLGIETTKQENQRISFHDESEEKRKEEIKKATDFFSVNPSFRGIAIHRYQRNRR